MATSLAAQGKPQVRRRSAPAARERKARGKGHERREEILAAARALFIAEGYETVTTRKLAARAGLSQTGLYVYFRSKKEILEAICHDTFRELAGVFGAAAAADTPADLALLRRLISAYIAFALAHPDEYQLTFMAGHAMLKDGRRRDLSLPFDQQGPGLQAFLLFREQVVRLVESGAMRRMDPTVAAQTIWMACHGLAALLIARPGFPWADRQQLIDALVGTLVRGLQNPSRRA